MKLEEIDEYDRRGKYQSMCSKCGKTHLVLTQEDDDSEYNTNVYVLCDCGEYVEFILPVS